MTVQRIAIFHPEGNIANNAHLQAFAQALYESGYRVDVFSHWNARCSYQQAEQYFYSLFLLPRGLPFPRFMNAYAFIFGVDEGIEAAQKQADALGVDYAHISYEIFFDDELKRFPELRQQKQRSKKAAANTRFSIVQDAVRAEKYCQEYGVPSDKVYLMPFAGAGIVAPASSQYLREYFSLAKEQRILLHMGSADKWAMIDWLLAQAETMPENWVLVVHDRYGIAPSVADSGSRRIFFHSIPASTPEEFAKIIQSAACCTALYRPTFDSIYTGKNLQYIGLASGKFANALRHGIPVLVNSGTEMAGLVKKYKAGLVCSPDNGDTLAVLAELPPEAICRQACQALFSGSLDLRLHMPGVLSLVEQHKTSSHSSKEAHPENILGDIFLYLKSRKSKIVFRLYFIAIGYILLDIFSRVKRKMRKFLSKKHP